MTAVAVELDDIRLQAEIRTVEVGLAIAFLTRGDSPNGVYSVDERVLAAVPVGMDSWYRPQAERLAELLNELDRRHVR